MTVLPSSSFPSLPLLGSRKGGGPPDVVLVFVGRGLARSAGFSATELNHAESNPSTLWETHSSLVNQVIWKKKRWKKTMEKNDGTYTKTGTTIWVFPIN